MKATPEECSWHQRITARDDPIAFSELAEHFYNPLVRSVLHKVQQKSIQLTSTVCVLVEEAVGTALLDYNEAPDRYDPQRASLFGYIAMLAYSRFHDAWKSEQCATVKSDPLSKLDSLALEQLIEQQDVDAHLHAQELWEYIQRELVDAQERKVVALMLNNIRETIAYSQVLGIDHLPPKEQQKAVKRIKERIGKRLRRIVRRYQQ